MKTTNLITIPNNEASWIAISLAIPSYLIVLIGTAPFFQGVFYLIYLIGIFFIWQRRQHENYSTIFIVTSLIFLSAWIAPNVVTKFSSRIESDMLSFPTLIYHVVVLSVLVWWARSWSISQKNYFKSWEQSCCTLLLLLTPLLFLIIVEIFRLKLEFPNYLNPPTPFNYRHLIGEILLMFCLAGFAISGRNLKLIVLAVTILTLTLIQNRGGLLSVGIIVTLNVLMIILNTLSIKKIVIGLVMSTFLAYVFYDQLYKLMDYFFLFEHKYRGFGSGFTHRLTVWIETWQEIQRVPWTGVGFWVSPYPYGNYFNFAGSVHNIFLRLWVENGTGLFLAVMAILMTTAVQIERKKLHWHRMAFWSILVYYFFIPRHLTLNPLSILLYWTIIQALCLPVHRKIQ